MNNTNLEQEIIKYSKGLSKEALEEIIDFIKFLKFKNKHQFTDGGYSDELSILSSSQTAHLEREFKDYKKLYPHE